MSWKVVAEQQQSDLRELQQKNDDLNRALTEKDNTIRDLRFKLADTEDAVETVKAMAVAGGGVPVRHYRELQLRLQVVENEKSELAQRAETTKVQLTNSVSEFKRRMHEAQERVFALKSELTHHEQQQLDATTKVHSAHSYADGVSAFREPSVQIVSPRMCPHAEKQDSRRNTAPEHDEGPAEATCAPAYFHECEDQDDDEPALAYLRKPKSLPTCSQPSSYLPFRQKPFRRKSSAAAPRKRKHHHEYARSLDDNEDYHPHSDSENSVANAAFPTWTVKKPRRTLRPHRSLHEHLPFTFKAVLTYGPHWSIDSYFDSTQLQTDLQDLWDRLKLVQDRWEDAKGALWQDDFIHKAYKTPCLTKKALGGQARWRKGCEGRYACADCVEAVWPCFTWDREFEEFLLLPLHEDDRVREVERGLEIRYWLNL